MSESASTITSQVVADHGLNEEEYARILKALGREPNLTELGIFSVMWSEHCSYKSSRIHLKKLPTTGPQVICGPGENAGVVDIGDGQAEVAPACSRISPALAMLAPGGTTTAVSRGAPPEQAARSKANMIACKNRPSFILRKPFSARAGLVEAPL